MKAVWMIIALWYSTAVCAQIDTSLYLTSEYFASPVDHQIKLSGSFGELRTNHFHAGIDIKSRTGSEGDTIRSAAPGHVSRVKLQRGSYGKALYIDHPNGYTTVYAHLQRFNPETEAYIRRRQRAAQSYELDVYLHPDSLTVDRGQYIGLLGNTGRSYGPHLHFEIRHTASETPQNPYLHGLGPADSSPPLLYAVQVEGMDSELRSIVQQSVSLQATAPGSYGPSQHFKVPAWRAGLSIQSFDRMDGATNSNGLYELKMYLDDSLHFAMKLDSVDWDETRYINSFIDYREKKNNNRTMIRCYKQKGNALQVYDQLRNNGYFKLYKDKPRHIRFEARDFYGNLSTYECTVSRSEQELNSEPASYNLLLKHDIADTIKLGTHQLIFPVGSTDNLLPLKLTADDESYRLTIGSSDQPLFNKVTVTTSLTKIPPALVTKAVLIYTDTSTPISYGGYLSGQVLTSEIDKLGNYSIALDTVPPIIESLEYSKNARDRSDFKFRVRDNYSTRGNAKKMTYSIYIDGVWVAAELKDLGHVLSIPLEGVYTGQHILKIIATDHSGNTATWSGTFSS